MKRILVLVVALAMATTMLVGVSLAEDEPITLRIVWWGSQTRHDATLAVIDMYMEQHPNVTIEAEYMAWSNYWDKLASQAAAGTMPDIFQNDYNYIETYATNKLSIPMDAFVGNEVDVTNIDQVNVDGGRVNGELHGLSLGTGGPTIIYDPDVFAELNMEEPNETWTYQDFETAMRKIHEEKGIFGATMLYDGAIYRGFEAYARQCGESIYNAEGKLNFDRQTLIDYLTMYTGWQNEGLVATPDLLADAKINIESDLIVTGRSAMVWRNSNQVVGMSAAAGKTLKMTYLPRMEGQKQFGGYVKQNQYFSISKDSRYPEEAAKFISFFVNDIEANKILAAERGVPASSAVREAMYDNLSEVEKVMYDYLDGYPDNASPMDPPQPASYNEVQQLFDRCEEQVVYGEKTVEEAVDELIELANKSIENTTTAQ